MLAAFMICLTDIEMAHPRDFLQGLEPSSPSC